VFGKRTHSNSLCNECRSQGEPRICRVTRTQGLPLMVTLISSQAACEDSVKRSPRASARPGKMTLTLSRVRGTPSYASFVAGTPRCVHCEVTNRFVSELCHIPPKPWGNIAI
jgi:hypothetical protein